MSLRHRRKEPASEVPRGDEQGAGSVPPADAPPVTREPFAGVPLHPAHESDSLVALVAGMPAGSRLGLERVRPEYAKGWCTTIELPHGATIDYVLDVVRESWGGGTYRLKPLTARGSWAPGAVTVNIAGDPLYQGHRYNRDGTIDDGTRPPASQQQWYPQQPAAARAAQPVAPPADNPQIVTALSGLVQSLAGNQTAEVRAKLDEVTAALRTAPQVAAPAPVDGFGEVRKSLELLRSLKELAGDLFDGGGDDAPAPAGAPPIDPQMMQMMHMMGMGGGAPGAPGMPAMPFGGMPFAMPKKSEDLMLMLAMQWMQQRNQPQPQGGQWVQGPNGAPVYVVPVQTPQGVQWMPMQSPQQQAAPMQPQPQWSPPPQPQAAPPPPQWSPPPQQRQAPPPPPPVVDVEAHTARPQQHDEPEQLTPQDVLEQLSRMDGDSAARFFDEVGSNLPPHVQGALVAMMQRMQQPPQQQPQQQQQRPANVVGMSPFALSYEHDK